MKLPILTTLIIILCLNGTGYSQRIVTYKLNDLNFGDVFIGYSEEVLHTDERAAKFYFYHTKFYRADLLITFNLPGFLTNGKNNIPIKFNSSHAAWSRFDRKNGRKSFNPNSPLELRRTFFYFPTYIWLGGSINTNYGLAPGIYNGTITLTIEFL